MTAVPDAPAAVLAPSAAGAAEASDACAHCGLPVSGVPRPGKRYCCTGCRMAAAAAGGGGVTKSLEARLVVSAFLAMGSMEFTLVLYGDSLFHAKADGATGALRTIGAGALIVFSLPVLLLLAPPILRGAIDDLRARRFRTDGLVVLATGAAWGLSVWHALRGAGEVYFETATMLLVLLAFGRRLEAHARTQGRDAARTLLECVPRTARRVVAGADQDVSLEALRVGDVVRVAPGAGFPADVVVTEGRTEVRAAHVTGEEAPRDAGPGDGVPAGAVNGTGAVLARVERTAEGGSIGRILALLDQPLPATRTTRMADRLAGWLAIVSVALAVLGGWRSYTLGGWPDAVRTAVCVLLVACPCALGLATPLAFRAIRAALARRGVLVRDPAALEVAATIDRVLFDKTGTLTDATASRLEREAGSDEAFARLEALVAHSGHTLAATVRTGGAVPSNVTSVPGAGVAGEFDGVAGRAGSPAWMDRDGLVWDDEIAARRAALEGPDAGAATLVAYAERGRVVALGAVGHTLRPGAALVVERLRRLGVDAEILSGDRASAVTGIGAKLGIPARGGLTPSDKVARIESLRAGGERVLMAGDGVNDAPALRAADVGVAMAQGTAAARSQAQVEVLGDDLAALARFVEASRVLRRTVRGNLAWNVAYNAVALAAAASGHLHPIVAVAAMIASSLTVSVRSYRLLRWGEGA